MEASYASPAPLAALTIPGVLVAPEALQAYAREARVMAHRVTERVLADPAFRALRSVLPPALLDNNHRNHALFMVEVLRSSAWGALTRSLPWVYYSRRGQGIPYAYFLIELAAWKAVVADHIGTQGAGIVQLYDNLLCAHEQVVVAAEALAEARRRSVAAASSRERAFFTALIEADEVGLRALCHDYLSEGHSFVDLLQHAFRPAMVEIGACWADGSVSVEQEHQATATANFVLSSLYVEQPLSRLERGRAVVATVSGDEHQLGAWMIAAGLESDGWEVALLGDPGDGSVLRPALLEHEVAFVALSATMLAQLSNVRSVITKLRQTMPHRMPRLVVGGQALAQAPELFETLGADAMLFSIDSVIHWARPLSTPSTPSVHDP